MLATALFQLYSEVAAAAAAASQRKMSARFRVKAAANPARYAKVNGQGSRLTSSTRSKGSFVESATVVDRSRKLHVSAHSRAKPSAFSSNAQCLCDRAFKIEEKLVCAAQPIISLWQSVKTSCGEFILSEFTFARINLVSRGNIVKFDLNHITFSL